MSQFRVQKVTKVKGLSELGKVGGSESSSTKKSRAYERPQTQPRQKKSSATKTSEVKSTTESKGLSASEKTGAPLLTTRGKAAAAKKTTARNCPDKKNASPKAEPSQAKSKPAAIVGPKLPPRQHTGTKAKTAPPQRPPPREQSIKKRPEIKKENSYDASCSDSDEQGSREKLSPEGDGGYETGTFDDSDISNSELHVLSPLAKDKNKNILDECQAGNTGYSYATVEFRPLILQEEVGIGAPVETRHPVELQQEAVVSNKEAGIPERNSYAYASAEFRALIVEDEIGVAAPIDSKKVPCVVTSPVPECRKAPMTYEEVEVISGEFDRANVNMIHLKEGNSMSQNASAIEDSTYSEVSEELRSNESDALSNGREHFSTSTPVESVVQQDFHVNGTESIADIYAVVQKTKTKKVAQSPTNENTTEQAPETSPRLPPREEASSSLYESITGELQDMIKACDENNLHGGTSNEREVGMVTNLPPSLPKPYMGAGPVSPTVESTPFTPEQDVYAAVQKKPKDKHKQKEEKTALETQPESIDIPPPLPNRPVLDDNDTLKREMSHTSLVELEESREKPKRSGLGFFKNIHRRKMSDGSIALNSENMLGYLSPASFTKKKGHRRTKSQDDVTRVINISYEDIKTGGGLNGELMDKERIAQGHLVQPYLEVDITEPPHTPRELQQTEFWEERVEEDDELPDGWKEVESENGTKYYWHVASGTTQWERPQVATRPKKRSSEEQKALAHLPEKQKVLSFPVHSMGWIELEESQVAPHNMSETISDCIATLARKRNDLWSTNETWGEGKDIRLLLEGDTLKLVEPRSKVTLLVQPVSKMRVWGVGKEDHRDFAYVARDPSTSKHKCHMFRCHGNISGRAITNALHEMCNKILEEKKRVQEIVRKNSQQKPWSDIINTPPPPSSKDHAAFNEKPFREQKKTFTAKYIGSTEVPKPTGMDTLNRAINKVACKGGTRRTVLIEVTVSSVKVTDCTSQEVLAEDRVRFLSFMGVGKDDRMFGYIMVSGAECFVCHVFQCTPNAATLAKALEEACQLRYQKCLDAHPELAGKVPSHDVEKTKEKEKDKGNFITSMQGLLGKLGPRKGGGKKDESTVVTSPPLPKPSHTFMVKYYGALPVAVGTGIETVQEAAKHLTGGTLLVCQLDVAINGVTLHDSQRSALSRRHIDADTISYCGLTSDSSHFGLIQSQGGGKYICHVFSEYKTKAAPIVAAIHETL